MISDLNLPVAALRIPAAEPPSSAFDACVSSKNRLLMLLSSAFFMYYFALIVGAGRCRSLFTLQVLGGMNLGTVFALSQYLFVAGLAVVYTRRMTIIDARIKVHAATRNVGDQP